MTKAPFFTFSGGVLSRALWGRADLQKYMTGLRSAHNMMIGVEGGALKRPGTYFVGSRKHPDKVSRLIKWRIANDDSYMLEFAEGCIRFIRFGGFVSIPSGHVPASGSVAVNVDGLMEVPTSYTESELRELNITSANDILYIFHGSHQVMQLKRFGLYDWGFEELDFSPHPAFAGTLSAVYYNTTIHADNYVAEPIPTSYMVSATLSDGVETLPSAVTTVNADMGHQRTKVTLKWTAHPDAVQYTVYKGQNGIYGFIAYTEEGILTYDDRNYSPDFNTVPLKNKFEFPDGEYPSVGEFRKQRMVFAAPPSRPQLLTFSRPVIFNSLFYSVPTQDDDALQFQLLSRERHTIRHMVELDKFLIFSDTAEWVLETSGGGALTAATADPKIKTRYGADPYLSPIPIGDRVLFPQNITGIIHDLGHQFTTDSFTADDLSRLSRDLFKNVSLVAWDYAAYPNNLIPVITSDGTAQVMTYVRQHEIWAWAHWETTGKFTDFASVTEVSHDGAYFQVDRQVNGETVHYIERMEFNFDGVISNMIYSDCAITYLDEREFATLTVSPDGEELTLIGVTGAVAPGDYFALCEGDTVIPGVVSAIAGGTIVLTNPRIGVDFSDVAALAAPELRRCAITLTGLDHLEGCGVWALCDGKVVKNLTVSGGSITLSSYYSQVHVGLPYPAYLETLDLDPQQLAGRYEYRAIDRVFINLMNSRGVWVSTYRGKREAYPISPRSTTDGYYPANSALDGVYDLPSHVQWGTTCALRVESSDPLPMNILAIVPDIKYED